MIMIKALMIVLIILVFIGIFLVFYFYDDENNLDGGVGCQEDAKVCGDGTIVYRIPPNCEFEKCPDEENITNKQNNNQDNECVELGCPENTLYVGSKNSDKFYECKCGWAKNIDKNNLVCFKSKQDALDDNRVESEC